MTGVSGVGFYRFFIRRTPPAIPAPISATGPPSERFNVGALLAAPFEATHVR